MNIAIDKIWATLRPTEFTCISPIVFEYLLVCFNGMITDNRPSRTQAPLYQLIKYLQSRSLNNSATLSVWRQIKKILKDIFVSISYFEYLDDESKKPERVGMGDSTIISNMMPVNRSSTLLVISYDFTVSASQLYRSPQFLLRLDNAYTVRCQPQSLATFSIFVTTVPSCQAQHDKYI